MPKPLPPPATPDCMRCRAYFVTHDPARPHGCRTFRFQSQRLPRDEVRLSSGQECGAFEPKLPPSKPTSGPH